MVPYGKRKKALSKNITSFIERHVGQSPRKAAVCPFLLNGDCVMLKRYNIPTKQGKKMRWIAISDIHGCDDTLVHLLEKLQAKPEELLFLGDYVDSGPNSVAVLRRLMQLAEQGATVLLGNHDVLLMDWLNGVEDIAYYMDVGGMATINSFLAALELPPVDVFSLRFSRQKEKEIQSLIQREFAAELQFLANRPLYEVRGSFLFVHAGIHPDKGLAASRKEELLTIREEFIHHYRGDQFIVFGHTRTRRLHGTDHVYRGANRVIGIDGGCAYGGQLNALIIQDASSAAPVMSSTNRDDPFVLQEVFVRSIPGQGNHFVGNFVQR
nr:hypothetical protein [Bacillota bacterium]